MIKYSIKIEGLEQALANLHKAPAVTVREVSGAVLRSISRIEREAKVEAPVNKQTGGGNLRQSIKSRKIDSFSGEIKAHAKYAAYVHEGTRPHTIRARKGGGLANDRTGQFFGKQVNHPGTKPNPFLLRAVQKIEDKIRGEFAKAVENILMVISKL